MKRRPKPEKRQRAKVDRHAIHRERKAPGRVFRVYPDPSLPFVVEVRVARTRRRMRDATDFHEGAKHAEVDREVMGLVRHYYSRIKWRHVIRPRGMVARMYLNVKDLQAKPSEIVAHECGHAAMAWARIRRANLSVMPGEEVMCYALGQLVRQCNHHLYAMGVFL